ncbi:hypothetical protein D3C73_1250710 [compost metagenome]
MRVGDVAHGVQPAHPGGLVVRGFQPRHKGFLVRALGRKAQVFVDGLAQTTGARQQQMGHGAPLVQHLGIGRQLFRPVQERQQLVVVFAVLQVGRRQPGRAAQRVGPAIRHGFAERVQVFADGLGQHGLHAGAVGTVTQQR